MQALYARNVFGASQYTTHKPSADAKPIGFYREVFGARQFVSYESVPEAEARAAEEQAERERVADARYSDRYF